MQRIKRNRIIGIDDTIAYVKRVKARNRHNVARARCINIGALKPVKTDQF